MYLGVLVTKTKQKGNEIQKVNQEQKRKWIKINLHYKILNNITKYI
jgi:hypothetical protein